MHRYFSLVLLIASAALISSGFAESVHAQARARQRAETAQIATPQATRAVDMFIKIEGIDGEATDHEHQGWIEVESWSWGEGRSPARRATPGGNGPGVLTLSRSVDRASPNLTQACASGRSLGRVLVHVRASGGGYNEYVVDDVSCSQASAGDRPTENVSLNFARVRSGSAGNPDRPIVVGR